MSGSNQTTMSQPGLANAVFVWAYDNPTRIAQLKRDRDAIANAMFGGEGEGVQSMTSASGNGKSFTALDVLPVDEKLVVLTEVLQLLGEVPAAAAPVRMTYGRFDRIER